MSKESTTSDPVESRGPCHPPTADDWDPGTYPMFIAAVFGPDYECLHDAVVDATRNRNVGTILDLGTGTGKGARRLLSTHEGATLVGIDANQTMLNEAGTIPTERVTVMLGRLEEPLPPGPFDLVVSVLTVHHLSGPSKADLFARISEVLSPAGRFVLGDIMRDPQTPGRWEATAEGAGCASGAIGDEGDVNPDKPDRLVDQIAWLTDAGLGPEVVWEKGRLAVVTADKPICETN